jgi:two-component sensor histidine kinase
VHLPATHAVVLGMAFHELTTNAARYGALSTALGRVEVEWHLEESGDATILTIDWCERGGPKVEAEPSLGFGSRLLRQAVVKELAGDLEVRFAPDGVCCTMALPIGPSERQAGGAPLPPHEDRRSIFG